MLSTTESTHATTAAPDVDRPTRVPGRRLLGLVGGVGLLAVAATASIAIGSRALGLGEVWDALWSAQGTADTVGIVRDLRVPRTLLGLLVGLAMGAAGALTQAHTRNPLADPGLLGVNAGAACAVVVGVYTLGITTPMQYMGFGLLGAVLAAAAVFGASAATKGASPITLVLAGTGLSALLLAITSGIVLVDTASLDAWRFWNVGSIVGRGTDVIWAALPFVVAGLLLAIGSGFFLNVLGLGDDMSRALGSRVVTVRIVGILAITLLSGAATAACGPIVFLGLVAPHLARAVVGADYRWVVPYSALIGAVLLLGSDVIGRVIARPGEVQVGIVLAVVGAPMLIHLVRARRLVSV
ncbi:iron chelate uptake ABC transporter family permease subunit [uncultured Williamsia sp.]|uniref:FecCD family ABC transporter permease n=1 Tax=uncultured Williamsia sp. TaxID=259311 RepID=UPI0026324677|nr:iron chelate uptake ABC transporter family permease subunit [uncultured Williamsia sp.]